MATSHMSHFTGKASVISHMSKVSKLKQSKFSAASALKQPQPAKTKDNLKIAGLFNKDSSDDDLEIDEKERMAQRELEELDMKYLIGDDRLDEDAMVGRTVNKNK